MGEKDGLSVMQRPSIYTRKRQQRERGIIVEYKRIVRGDHPGFGSKTWVNPEPIPGFKTRPKPKKI